MAPTKGTQGTKGRKFRLADLREKCKILASVVDTSGVATEADVRAARPGSPENPDRGVWGWIHYHANLVAFNARAPRFAGAEGAGGDPEQLILKALRRQPEILEPVAAGQHGVPERLVISPKGLDALFWFHEKDLLLARLADVHDLLRRKDDVNTELLERVSAEIAYQNLLLVWAACADGPWLPFDPYKEQSPTLPDWLRALDPRDVLGVVQRFQEVNGGRMRALAALLPAGPTDEGGAPPRASWSVFASSTSMELDVPAGTLMRDWSLGEVLAQVHIAANAKREAMDRARAHVDEED